MTPAQDIIPRPAHALRSDRARRLAATLLAALALSACSRNGDEAAPRQAATPGAAPVPAPAAAPAAAPPATSGPSAESKQAWMQAIFAQAYDPQKEEALTELEIDGVREHLLMTLVSATELPDGRIAVVVNGAQADENGADISGHGSPGILNVYLLLRDNGGWKVGERREGLSSLGSMGFIGGVTWVTLGPGKPGFIVASGGTWQGYSISHAEIFELGNGMRYLGSLQQASDNAGACAPETDCWDIDSAIGFAAPAAPDGYADLLVDFKGKHYTVSEEVSEDQAGKEVEHLVQAVAQRAVYRFDGKAYVLVSGANPVPSI